MNRYCILFGICLLGNLGASGASDTELQMDMKTGDQASDSAQMEKELQQLPWLQFRSVIESVPKLKADVDAYGAFGWQFVQGQYRHYPWKKKIDKLDDVQKRKLAELIHLARKTRSLSGSP